MHWPLIDFECGPEQGADTFIEWWYKADRGELEPFVLVVEGSIPNEELNKDNGGYFCGFGNDPDTGEVRTTNEWLDLLAPQGHRDHRRRDLRDVRRHPRAWPATRPARWAFPTTSAGTGSRRPACRSSACPGCPIHPDNLSETILYLLYQVAGQAPMIPLDAELRPQWLFGATVHEGCDRAGYYEQGEFATEYGSPKCIVKLGCWGPVVNCNVPKRGWINGIGGCPNVGGICIGCTMPGFPDKFMPFMDEPPGSKVSTTEPARPTARPCSTLRKFTQKTLNKEPTWRVRGPELKTGYQRRDADR